MRRPPPTNKADPLNRTAAMANGRSGADTAFHGSPHVHAKRPRSNAADFIPGKPTRWSQLHEVYVCRRYIQDSVCFGYDIPTTCIENSDLVLGWA